MSREASGSTTGDPDEGARPIAPRDFGILLVELALLVLVARQFHLEEAHRLPTALAITACGFALHAWLPLRFRLSLFLALSLGVLLLVLGPRPALFTLAAVGGVALIVLLPVGLAWRVLLLAGFATGLAWLRHGSDGAFWPIVGSMVMFRSIACLRDLRAHKGGPKVGASAERGASNVLLPSPPRGRGVGGEGSTARDAPPSPATPLPPGERGEQVPKTTRAQGLHPPDVQKTLAYFFVFPNSFFYLFPVLDYRTFCDGYYSAPRVRVYQSGVHWIGTGLLHLVLYRVINTWLLPDPLEIRSVLDLARFLAFNYALYLRISGEFHVICGMLHLFGFNLPRTHDCYFLASSFSDIWRRINIYWKDFLMKTVFLPAFFRLRGLGDPLALPLAVGCVFFATWLAHSWQVFWLLDAFPLRVEDAALWLGVGVIVAVNSLWDFRGSRRGARDPHDPSLAAAAWAALRTVGVFCCISLFWARWTNREVFRFLLFGDARLGFGVRDAAGLALWLTAGFTVAFAYQLFLRRRVCGAGVSPAAGQAGLLHHKFATGGVTGSLPLEQSAALQIVPAALLLVLGVLPLPAWLGPRWSEALTALKSEAPGGSRALRQVEGYYEQLNRPVRQASPFLDQPAVSRDDLGGRYAAMTQPRRDLLEMELIPGWKGEFGGAPISVNHWGMRDRERTLAKPAGVFRVAVVGSSPVMGYGVGDNETFAHLLEEELNGSRDPNGPRFEVLNFGVGGYFPIHRRWQIERKALPFRPDVILYFAHQDELFGSLQWLSRAVARGIDVEDACLEEVVRPVVADHASQGIVYSRLAQRLPPILECLYKEMLKATSAASVDLVWVYLPMPGVSDARVNPQLIENLARSAGLRVLDLTGWQAGFTEDQTMLADGNYHPSPLGHRLIAERLLKAFRERADLFAIPDSTRRGR